MAKSWWGNLLYPLRGGGRGVGCTSHLPAPRAQRLGSQERSEWDQLTRLCERSKQYLSRSVSRHHDHFSWGRHCERSEAICL